MSSTFIIFEPNDAPHLTLPAIIQFFKSHLRLKYSPRGAFRVMSTMHNWMFDTARKRWLFEKPISKSLLDERSYRLIMLENKLQVLLISDPSADQAGMALDVGVGHVSDPVSINNCSLLT